MPEESNAPTKDEKMNALLQKLGIRTKYHLFLNIFCIVAILIVVVYALQYDVPEAMKGKVCYEYYRSLDPLSQNGQVFHEMVGRIESLNVSIDPSQPNIP